MFGMMLLLVGEEACQQVEHAFLLLGVVSQNLEIFGFFASCKYDFMYRGSCSGIRRYSTCIASNKRAFVDERPQLTFSIAVQGHPFFCSKIYKYSRVLDLQSIYGTVVPQTRHVLNTTYRYGMCTPNHEP